jgi:hypothetical protein
MPFKISHKSGPPPTKIVFPRQGLLDATDKMDLSGTAMPKGAEAETQTQETLQARQFATFSSFLSKNKESYSLPIHGLQQRRGLQ